MKKYWLRLFPETFLWSNNGKSLIYNSNKKESFAINNIGLNKLVTEGLQYLPNLYCIELSESDLADPGLHEFIKLLEETSSGEIIEAILDSLKPITLVPILNLQSNIGKIKKHSPQSVGEQMLENLHSVTLVLTEDFYFYYSGNQNLVNIDEKKNLLHIINEVNFLTKLEESALGQINIILKNIPDQDAFDIMINKLDRMYIKKYFHFDWKYFNDNLLLLDFIKYDQYFIVIHVSGQFIKEKLNYIALTVKRNRKQVQWHFSITSEIEYEEVVLLLKELRLKNVEITPLFTEHNLHFFESRIYLTEEDFQTPDLSKKEVFAHQALNTNDFGKLTIMPDGKVYANPHFPALGSIEDDSRELIYKELTEGRSWLRIRDMKPCCDCVYQWLCPSPSDYEIVIGRPNLCKIIQ